MLSIRTLLDAAAWRFQTVSDTPRLDAEVLLATAMNKPRSYLLAWPERHADVAAQDLFSQWVEKRQQGQPIAHLTGQREFWSLPLQVNEHTLIPRPETEHLVERALAIIASHPVQSILELGTGSGAIALALASQRPDLTMTAVDICSQALQVATNNAQHLKLEHIHFIRSDWFSALTGTFDLIVSNPPYIAAQDPHLNQGDLRFEPQLALVSGHDGLNAIRYLIAEAPKYLNNGGRILLEHGYDQADAIADLLTAAQVYTELAHWQDLAGLPRLTEARYSPIST